jgi:hypothetical protein
MTSPGQRLVFVGGLHRSGTSLVARLLGAHPMVSAMSGTGVAEDEGQHVQSVYRAAREHGGPGRFARDPTAHLTEHSPLATPEHAGALLAQWAPYWDVTRPLLLEKSPPNLVRFRFLQALFPGAACVAVVRHPLAVALATRDAGMCDDPVGRQVEHWLVAHERFAGDRPAIDPLLVVRYEDLVADPHHTLGRITRFLDIAAVDPAEAVDPGATRRHVRRWEGALGRARRLALAARYERRVAALGFGYSLRAVPST